MISKELEKTLNFAVQVAHEQKHEFVTTEHLLLALLDNTSAVDVLRACNAEIDQLRVVLTEHLSEHVPNLDDKTDVQTQPSIGFQRVLQRAIVHVQSSGKNTVEGENILVALFSEQESHAAYYLDQQDVTRFDVVSYISHGISKNEDDFDALPFPLPSRHPTLHDERISMVCTNAHPLQCASHCVGRYRFHYRPVSFTLDIDVCTFARLHAEHHNDPRSYSRTTQIWIEKI